MNPLMTTSWTGLQTYRQRERSLLAPYAQFSANSRGRRWPEEEHPYRGPYQRDRDRIVHSAAFRRLADKTQVFTGLSDYHRTRLTHTMEVASIARTIGRTLRLNEDLIEALALVHDLGHPPFGHAGEEMLAECLAADGGFSHNQYALTIVEELESRYPGFPGLNLSLEVLESQTTRIEKSVGNRSLLEAQVVDIADSITYDAHDVDDAVKLGLVSLDDLMSVPLVRECAENAHVRRDEVEEPLFRKTLVRDLIDRQVTDLLERVGPILEETFGAAENTSCSPIVLLPSESLTVQKRQLESFLYDRVYRHPQIVAVREQAMAEVRDLWRAYVQNQDLLPPRFQKRAEVVGAQRAAADYLAGMTENFFRQHYERYVAG